MEVEGLHPSSVVLIENCLVQVAITMMGYIACPPRYGNSRLSSFSRLQK